MTNKLMSIRIENETGITRDTKVFDREGKQIRGVTDIRIEHISSKSQPIEARLDFEFIGLNIEAKAYVTKDQLIALAEQQGMKVVPK